MIKPLTEEQKKFAEENIPLVLSIAKHERPNWNCVDYDDYMSAAYLALTKAASTFDPTRGYTFSALLTRCLISEWNIVAAQRHYIQVPQHYDRPNYNGRVGFPEARKRASSMKREGCSNRDGTDMMASYPAPVEEPTWAYELTDQLPIRHRAVAERFLIRGEHHGAIQSDLEIGGTHYEAVRSQTRSILARLIHRNELARDAS